jgi:hypothetical protein
LVFFQVFGLEKLGFVVTCTQVTSLDSLERLELDGGNNKKLLGFHNFSIDDQKLDL